MRRHPISILAGLALLLVTTACGAAAEDPQVATAGGARTSATADADAEPVLDDEERMRRFTECMRANGVDLPDPEPGGAGIRVRAGAGAGGDPAKMEAAMAECRELMPNGGERPELSPEDLEKARAMSACLREHGIDAPDPDPDGGRVLIQPGAPRFDDDTMKRAMEACRHLGPELRGGRRGSGSGGAGSSGGGG